MLFYLLLETEKIMDWIDVNDRLPENGEFVLCAFFDMLDYWSQLEADTGGKPVENTTYIIRQLKTDDGHRWADEGVSHWCRITPPKQ